MLFIDLTGSLKLEKRSKRSVLLCQFVFLFLIHWNTKVTEFFRYIKLCMVYGLYFHLVVSIMIYNILSIIIINLLLSGLLDFPWSLSWDINSIVLMSAYILRWMFAFFQITI